MTATSTIEASAARSTQSEPPPSTAQRGRKPRRVKIPAFALALPEPEERLDYYLESFFRFICLLAAQYGFCSASNAELARWQKRDDSTITRRIKKLEEAGYIRVKQRPGVERRIYPQVAPLPFAGVDGWQEREEWEDANLSAWQRQKQGGFQRGKQTPFAASKKGKLAGGDAEGHAGGMQGVNPSAPFISNNISIHNNNPDPSPDADAAPPAPDAVPDPVVVALVDAGFCADKAAGFVSEVGPDCVRESLAVLKYYQEQGREIASPGGFLADFGRHFHAGTWSLPGGLVKQREEKRKEAEQAAEKARLAAVEAEKKRLNAELATARAEAKQAEKARQEAERDAMIPADLREPWRLALEKLQSLVNKPTFHTHILKLLPVSLTDDAVTITTEAPSTLDWLRDRHTDNLSKALSEALKRDVTVRLVLSTNWLASLATGRNPVSLERRAA